MIWSSGGSKSRLAKAAGAEPAGQMRDEKLHAVVARSKFASQNVQSTWVSDHFWKLRCRKSARRCGAKHISNSKVQKTEGTVASRGMRKGLCTLSKVSKTWGFCSIFKYNHHYTTLHHTTLNYTQLHYTTLHDTTLHYTTVHYTTLHYLPLHYITLHYITLCFSCWSASPCLPLDSFSAVTGRDPPKRGLSRPNAWRQ